MMQLTTSPSALFELAETDRGWRARVDETWRGWTGPHGGVIAALLVEVARRASDTDLPVRALDLRFLGKPREGILTFRAVGHPVGRSTLVVEVIADQQGDPIAAATVTLGRAGRTEIPARLDRPAPEAPAPEQCASFAIPAGIVPAAAHFDVRPAAGPLPLTGVDEAWMCAWIALTPTMAIEAATLAILADALPPALFPTLTRPVAIPTVALSMHLHTDLPEAVSPQVLVRTVNVSTGGGWSVDDTDIWDDHGRLLATARQSRRVLG